MEIKIFCMACKVEILRADTDTLRTPLIGNMFKVKKDMEWNLFSPHDTDKDLICPMCEWTFHEEGRVSVPVNGDSVIGKPEVIIPGIIACFMVTGISEKDEKAPEETKLAVEVPKEPNLIENQVPALNSLKEKVEGLKKVEEVKKAEQPQLNHGDWSKSKDADENSETEGKAPPGTEAIEPVVPKIQPRKYNRKTKKRNARKLNR